VAEQTAEIDEVLAHTGRRPVEWLLEHAGLDARWCCVHATHMTAEETEGLAASGAVAGLCPITEANLGDGIFPASRYIGAGGRFGVGSDSNVAISLAGELNLLEYSQRLNERNRAVIAVPGASVGRTLFEGAVQGAAVALARDAGGLAPGRLADLVALDGSAVEFVGQTGDGLLDAWLFASTANPVTDVWSAGRHVIVAGRHPNEARIEARFRRTLIRLTEAA
jgi:formimidoylglutamate deiminase